MSRTVLGAGATAVALGALVALALVLGTGLQHEGWPPVARDRGGAPRVDLDATGPQARVPAGADRERAAPRTSSADDLDGGAPARRPRTAAGAVPVPGSGRAPTPLPEGGAGTASPGARPVATPVGGEPARPVGPGDRVPRPASGAGAQPGEGGAAPGPVGGGPAPGGGPSRGDRAPGARPQRKPQLAQTSVDRAASTSTVARVLEPERGGAGKGRGHAKRDPGQGFEPRFTAPEAVVLPLDEPGRRAKNSGRTARFLRP